MLVQLLLNKTKKDPGITGAFSLLGISRSSSGTPCTGSRSVLSEEERPGSLLGTCQMTRRGCHRANAHALSSREACPEMILFRITKRDLISSVSPSLFLSLFSFYGQRQERLLAEKAFFISYNQSMALPSAIEMTRSINPRCCVEKSLCINGT